MRQRTKRALDRIKQRNFAKRVLMSGEDENELYELCDQLLLEFSPCGPVQEECVLSIAAPLWRKLHPQAARVTVRSSRPFNLKEALAAYDKKDKAEKNDIIRPEEPQEGDETRIEPPKLDPESLAKQREITAALDVQIAQAIKQMIAMQQIKNASTLIQ